MDVARSVLLVVLGAPRSGIGVMARGLQALGARPLQREPGALNLRVLQALGATPASVASLAHADWNSLDALHDEAARLLADPGASAPRTLADASTARLLRFWQPAFQRAAVEARYVIVHRNPLSVAHALAAQRDAPVERELSHLLWLEHYLEALLGTHGLPRVAIDFDELIDDPAAQLRRACRELELPPPAESAAGLADLLDPRRVHAAFDAQDVAHEAALAGPARRCHRLLEALSLDAAAADQSGWSQELLEIEAQWKAGALARRRLDGLAQRLHAAERELKHIGKFAEQTQHGAFVAMTHMEQLHRNEQRDLRRVLVDKLRALERVHEVAAALMREQGSYGARIGRAITRARRRLAPEGSLRWRALTLMVRTAKRLLGRGGAPAAPAPAPAPADAPAYAFVPNPRSLPSVLPLNLATVDALAARPTLNVLLPGLALRAMTGGPNTALNISYRMAARHGVAVRYISTDAPMQDDRDGLWAHLQSVTGVRERLPLVQFACGFDRSVPLPIGRNDVFLGTAWWTVQMVKHALKLTAPRRFLYLIQEFEPGLYPWSSEYALALETYGLDFHALINQPLVAEHLRAERVGRFADPAFLLERCAVFEPAIERKRFHVEPPAAGRRRRLLFYARPVDARRNLFELALYALRVACEQGVFAGEPWELCFIGEQLPATELAPGVAVRSLAWLGFDEYARTLRQSDVLLSMMLSPHTSYPPLEIAACGGIAVTCEYSVKTAARLAGISPNIVGVPPTVEGIVDGLRRAVQALGAPGTRRPLVRVPESWDDALAEVVPRAVAMFHDCLATRP